MSRDRAVPRRSTSTRCGRPSRKASSSTCCKTTSTYKRFFGLIKRIENDPNVPKKKAAKALGQFLELHPVNIEQVVSVIVEHFRLDVMHELGGRAKAMVVTGSRLSAVSYKKAFDRYIEDKGYHGIRALVAFSGTVEDPDVPGLPYTEVGMNDGLPERSCPNVRRRRLSRADRCREIPDRLRPAAVADHVCRQEARGCAGCADAFAP